VTYGDSLNRERGGYFRSVHSPSFLAPLRDSSYNHRNNDRY